MKLMQELLDLYEQAKAKRPENIVRVMSRTTEELVQSEIAENSLQQGDHAPDFILPNALGKDVQLKDLLTQGPVVVSFYRGKWCPYCNLELQALQRVLPRIKELGASLLAISPQTPDNTLSTKEKHGLTFEVVSDVGNQAARKFGLVFQLPKDLFPVYEGFGIDLPAHNGDQTFELPIPATYVIGTDGTIVFAHAHADYTKRVDTSEIIHAMEKLG